MKRALMIAILAVLPAVTQAGGIGALLAGHGRITETSWGYRTDNARIVRTQTGYRATLDDGRIIVIHRTTHGWRYHVAAEGRNATVRHYFHR